MNLRTNTFAMAITLAAVVLTATDAYAQRKKKVPDGSQAAAVVQTIGVDAKVTINYHRPGVKGRNVWTENSDNPRIGRLVPFNEDPKPWRAGANEATTIEFSEDVLVEGKPLAAGAYALFMVPTEKDWTIIFNSRVQQWGAFQHKKEEDVLRVTVMPTEAPAQEWLSYGFDNPDAWSTTAYMHWEKVKVSFKIETAKKEASQ